MISILLIEDEPQMRRNMETVLSMEGFRVISAENGRVGVDKARAENPDLVLCDVMMPELDGYGVLETLRKQESTKATPFIFLTAKGEKPDIRLGMNLGADDYLTKPVAIDDLLSAIQSRLDRARQQAEAAQAAVEFQPDFSSAKPLEALGLTPRESEVLLWVAQGKTNAEVAIILGMVESTVKKHLEHIFEKLGIESRNAATLRAIEVLSTRSRIS
ncbi:MAG: response regulator transcription factor [Verrucomicrobiales bacterium]|jgi:DNA-binding NarL/FixJ family response regulator|nr:response regulator transcription factor [Verrucomicrobiales bacterium]